MEGYNASHKDIYAEATAKLNSLTRKMNHKKNFSQRGKE